MTLKELFTNNKTIPADGAMGTYFTELTGESSELCEKYNIIKPEIISRIHKEYIDAGAAVIRTNTFSANSLILNTDHSELEKIIRSGYRLAIQAAGDKAVVCADVGAIYENPNIEFNIFEEYKFIIDCFISEGARTFIFETLSELDAVLPAIDYIREKIPNAEIIASFTILPDGNTRSGVPMTELSDEIVHNKNKLTAVGINCGGGAAQIYTPALQFFSHIRQNTDLYLTIMPNAGYPSIVHGRTLFNNAPSYFAEQAARFIPHGISAIGGCCGTTPEYIRLISKYINGDKGGNTKRIPYAPEIKKKKPEFSSKLMKNQFVIAAELDPPNGHDFTKIIEAAKILKSCGVDIITVSDSPLGHAKADPVICSAKISREVDIEVLPHLCCRDRNINALRSILYGAHIEGIRAVLAVTGDHIAETDRGIIKPVFNLDSTKLMSLISMMNSKVFADSPIAIGGAFDPAAPKPEFALKRLEKKISCGAKFVLTQPVFTDDAIECLKEARRRNIRILGGVMPMVSYRNANYMKNEVPGMVIPDELVRSFFPNMSREDSEEVGINIAVRIIEKLRNYVDGIYFMTPFNRAEIIKKIIIRSGLR